jgi:neutral ceramidase
MPLDRRAFLAALGAATATPLDAAAVASRVPARQGQASGGAAAAGWRAGLATVDITPPPGVWMGGYAARKEAAQGTAQPLHAKALAIEDAAGEPVVLVTLDLLGLTAEVAGRIADGVTRLHGVPRARLLLCSSHTHSGPVINDQLAVAYDLTPEQWEAIRTSTRSIERKVVDVVGRALAARQPARLRTGQGSAAFAANRRTQFTPDGPVDHAVPVLSIESPDGALRGVVFGYACHNTTLQATAVRYHGDYAGVAQRELESRHRGAVAMFVAGCGADANPSPRGTEELVEQHGRSLADAVDAVLPSATTVTGTLRAAFEEPALAYAPPPPASTWRERLAADDVYERRHARLMLDIFERDGRLPAYEPAPLHVVRLGDLTLVTLSGEVVVDYALAIKQAYGERTWVAGYTDTVFGYVPSVRVLREGGYEGGGAMLYYGRPGPFDESVERTLLDGVKRLMAVTSA